MSQPISVGDLVMVVKATPCCGRYEPFKAIFTVKAIDPAFTSGCRFCHASRTVPAAEMNEGPFWTDMNRLKRIPPIEELEGEKQKEDLREPA